MAILHRAEVRPTKLELLSEWLPSRRWATGAVGAELQRVASFRFDDPEGEVGIETVIVRDGSGRLLQVPLTYRGAPAGVQDDYLIGTMQHSVLGQRWVYDAGGDPVYVAALASAVLNRGSQAAEFLDVDGRLEPREPSAQVQGSGVPSGATVTTADLSPEAALRVTDEEGLTRVRIQGLELVLVRLLGTRLDGLPENGGAPGTLSGTWSGQAEPIVLAALTIT